MIPTVLYNGIPRWHATDRALNLAGPGPKAPNPFLPRLADATTLEAVFR